MGKYTNAKIYHLLILKTLIYYSKIKLKESKDYQEKNLSKLKT